MREVFDDIFAAPRTDFYANTENCSIAGGLGSDTDPRPARQVTINHSLNAKAHVESARQLIREIDIINLITKDNLTTAEVMAIVRAISKAEIELVGASIELNLAVQGKGL